MRRNAPTIACTAAVVSVMAAWVAAAPAPVDFDRDIKPLLADRCFACHGFDANARKAGLRLDVKEGATARLPSGRVAVVPGNPEASELMRRVASGAMPPPSLGKRLSAEQVDLLRRWIAQGAPYGQHWAFVPPKRPSIPRVRRTGWVRNPIDAFILARLEQEGLTPNPEADRATLIRRVSLDLTGLPPTPEEVDAFLRDPSPDAYEKVVDRLLASPHFGERMAVQWLDLARYADTHGYHIDSHRDMWRWREWVIEAFNRNLPYDQFLIEQLAGDLLPNPTLDQRIATGFNRNHPINFEGGAIPEEYQTAYVLDRVDTTATVFMALTMRCGQCHDHKYDPLTQREFYQFYAFFNNIAEEGLDGRNGNAAPFIKAPRPEQEAQLAAYRREIEEREGTLRQLTDAAGPAAREWAIHGLAAIDRLAVAREGLVRHIGFDDDADPGPVSGRSARAEGIFRQAFDFDGNTSVDLGDLGDFERTDAFSYGAWIYPTTRDAMTVVSRMDDEAGFRGWDLYLAEGKVYVHLISRWEGNAIRVITRRALEPNRWYHVFVTYDGSSKAAGVRVYVDGKPEAVDVTHDRLQGSIRTSRPLRIGRRHPAAPFRGRIDEVRIYARQLSAQEVEQLAGLDRARQVAATPAGSRTAEQQRQLVQFYLENFDPTYRRVSAELAEWRRKYQELDAAIPTTMVMQERETPRPTHILIRGQYDQKGERVEPGTPACLPPFPAGAPRNRLGLAQWLVQPDHPLTARVAVNRLWQMLFGVGIVRTSEDFGTQGERPSHPELLDWLATEFVRTGWDVKGMLRLIVTSATYRQSSQVTALHRERDPENRLLARAPRIRLAAEFLRDQALAVSGLLVRKLGGPSVKPYQPPGLWEELAFGGGYTAQKYEQDHGEALYRRSLYIFWKRTCPPPAMQAFDAPEREFCLVRRSATNTPLQALVLMNDITYVEAARKLAERILKEGGASPRDCLRFAYRVTLAREPTEQEIRTLVRTLNRQRERYRTDRSAAEKLLSVGESPRDPAIDAAELAAWTGVASVLLNLDEFITRG